jgi:type II secretory pathway pseudopilin PulG
MSTFQSQRGYTMALALAVAVVMGIMLMKAGPLISKEVQRENEEDLIFRGEAIQEALRLFAAKTGRYPTSLDDVMKVRPRILRQKYKDPMTATGEWEYVTQVQPGASGNTDGLPIIGVRSRGKQDAIHIYKNKTLIHDWLFAPENNLLGITDAGGGGRTGIPRTGTSPAFPPLPTSPSPLPKE